jgi:hypothetical protein
VAGKRWQVTGGRCGHVVLIAAVVSSGWQLKTSTSTYESRMEVDGKVISRVPVRTEITHERGLWIITETVGMPSGDVSETIELEPETLIVRKHAVMQGPMRMVAAFHKEKMLGSVTVGAQTTRVEKQIGGLWPGGGGLPIVVATLPLAENYTTTLLVFEMRSMDARPRQPAVTAIEEVAVPAGKFRAFRIAIRAPKGDAGEQTIWVTVDTRRVVKTVTAIPEGNALVITELVK